MIAKASMRSCLVAKCRCGEAWLTPSSRLSSRNDKCWTPRSSSATSAARSNSWRRLPWWYGRGEDFTQRSLQCYPKFYRMLSLTTMLSMTTFHRMKLTENTILVTGIGRRRTEAFHALGDKVIIAGRREEVLDQTTDANSGIASVTRDERRSACASL